MADVVSPARRSQMMAGIKSKHTRPERFLRSGLHVRGFRFRLHGQGLPGAPDMIFPKYKAVLFAHGCFWHGHNCHLFKWPKSREDFWKGKIESNRARDQIAVGRLIEAGWRVGVVWECALKGKYRHASEHILQKCEDWLRSSGKTMELGSIEARPPL